jgi:cytochrome c biogenesis protein CcdA
LRSTMNVPPQTRNAPEDCSLPARPHCSARKYCSVELLPAQQRQHQQLPCALAFFRLGLARPLALRACSARTATASFHAALVHQAGKSSASALSPCSKSLQRAVVSSSFEAGADVRTSWRQKNSLRKKNRYRVPKRVLIFVGHILHVTHDPGPRREKRLDF